MNTPKREISRIVIHPNRESGDSVKELVVEFEFRDTVYDVDGNAQHGGCAKEITLTPEEAAALKNVIVAAEARENVTLSLEAKKNALQAKLDARKGAK